MNLYDQRDPRSQGLYFIRHMSAMTTEQLHDKGDIAAELAHRDIIIDELKATIEKLNDK